MSQMALRLLYVVLETIGLALLALFSFMAVVFWGGALGATKSPAAWIVSLADKLLWILPLLCVVAAILLWIAYANSWSTLNYYWILLPGIPFILFVVFIFLTLPN